MGWLNKLFQTKTGPSAEEVVRFYQDFGFFAEVLREINSLIAASGRRFECAVDGNFALVVCLTAQIKNKMRAERGFPFAW